MNIQRRIYWKLSLRFFVSITNFFGYIKYGSFNKIKLKKQGKLLLIKDVPENLESKQIYLSRKERLHLYTEGVNSRLDSLANQYLLKTVELDINDLIIDIGANIGEFSKYLLEKGFENIICIEPDQMEAHACDANVFNGQKQTIRKCLWNYSGILRFYLHNNTGDSSATPNDLKWPSVEVPCITLDEIIKERGIKRIGLIKLEAEGSEPEVLGGALESIALTKWILADLGHERGPEQESTFLEVNRILLDNHFVLVAKGGSGLRESYKYRNLRVNL